MVGRVTSEGDRAMASQVARRNFSIDGRGIKIGILSDSFNRFQGAAADVASGDLPGRNNPTGYTQPVRVLKDSFRTTDRDEGRAMAQIIHDIAPGAELLFHEAGNSEDAFAEGIRALTAAGATIIVDDIGYTTSMFQDGVAAQAVSAAADQGIIYISAAGNDGDRAYASDFRSGSTFQFRGSTYAAHDFDAGPGEDVFQSITIPDGRTIDLLLSWDQPVGQVNNDVQLFLLDQPQFPNAGGEGIKDAIVFSSGNDAPYEKVLYITPEAQTVYLLVAHNTNSAAPGLIKWISTSGGADDGVIYEYVNDGQGKGSATIYGHPNAQGAIAVGAAFYSDTPAFGVTPPQLESFSSRGGTPILFDRQGNRLATPEVRQKPDIVGPDGVSTSVVGFETFLGTSAAAPHIAGVVALMLQRAGGRRRLTPAQVRTALQQGAIALGDDSVHSEAGLVQAATAVLNSALSTQTGTEGNDRLQGGNQSDNLWGLLGDDTLNGADGLDALNGGAGQDQLRGDRGNDYLLGGPGQDRLVGGAGQDFLTGGAGGDRLAGGAGDDRLRGGPDNDWMDGGQGRNELWSGAGRDRLVLRRGSLALVQDFQMGRDRFLLMGRLTTEQLDIQQQGQDTVITALGDTLAQLRGISADSLTDAAFRVAPISPIV